MAGDARIKGRASEKQRGRTKYEEVKGEGLSLPSFFARPQLSTESLKQAISSLANQGTHFR